MWQVSGARIRARKCLKKNLVPDTIYEFRVRTLLPRHSAWSDPLAVATAEEDDDEDDESITAVKRSGRSSSSPSKRAGRAGGEDGNDNGEGFAAAGDAVQREFESGASEEVIRGMLERVAERFVASDPDDAHLVLREMADAVSQNYRTATASVKAKNSRGQSGSGSPSGSSPSHESGP